MHTYSGTKYKLQRSGMVEGAPSLHCNTGKRELVLEIPVVEVFTSMTVLRQRHRAVLHGAALTTGSMLQLVFSATVHRRHWQNIQGAGICRSTAPRLCISRGIKPDPTDLILADINGDIRDNRKSYQKRS